MMANAHTILEMLKGSGVLRLSDSIMVQLVYFKYLPHV